MELIRFISSWTGCLKFPVREDASEGIYAGVHVLTKTRSSRTPALGEDGALRWNGQGKKTKSTGKKVVGPTKGN